MFKESIAWTLSCPTAPVVPLLSANPLFCGIIPQVALAAPFLAIGTTTCAIAILSCLRKREGRSKVISVTEERCIGCGRCTEQCKHRVLKMQNGPQGPQAFVKHPEKCTACGHCRRVCRTGALQLTKPRRNEEQPSE